MTPEQKAEYKKLDRQVGEAYQKYVNTRTNKSIHLFNNRLARIQQLLTEVGYSDNRFLKMKPLSLIVQ